MARTQHLAFLFSSAVLVGGALGQTTITGTAGGDNTWNDASNWSAGVPPAASTRSSRPESGRA